jgi:hypothetical protein
VGDWKLVRQNLGAGPNAAKRPTTELYDLATDPHETNDVAAKHPEVLKQLTELAKAQHTPTKLWPIRALDAKP